MNTPSAKGHPVAASFSKTTWLDEQLDGAVGVYIGMAAAAAYFAAMDEKPTWGNAGIFLALALVMQCVLSFRRVRRRAIGNSAPDAQKESPR